MSGFLTPLSPPSTGSGYTDEQVRDVVASLLVAGSNITLTYDDALDTLTIDAAGGGAGITLEQAMDQIAAMLVAGTGITLTYNDGADTLTVATTITQYTDEMAMDAIAAMLVAGTGITVSYNDGTNQYTLSSSITQYTDEMARDALGTALVAGSGVTITVNDAGDTITIAATGGGGGTSVGKNLIIGGDFSTNPWSHGTSIVSPIEGQYLADRWKFIEHPNADGNYTITKDTDVPTVAQAGRLVTHSLKVDVTTVATLIADTFAGIQQAIEGFNWLNISQREITLSFWHKHTKTGVYGVSLTNEALTRTYPAQYTQDVSDTWEKATITIPASPSTGVWGLVNDIGVMIRFFFYMHTNRALSPADVWTNTSAIVPGWGTVGQVNGADNVANNMRFALIQLETGAAATEFEQRTIQEELELLSRYEDVDQDTLTFQPVELVRNTKNAVIGGDFSTNPWQRGTSFAAVAAGAYTADRWSYNYAGLVAVHTISKQADAPTIAQCGILTQHCLHVDCTTADTTVAASDYAMIDHKIEGYNWKNLAQRSCVLTFWHKHTKTGIYTVGLLNSVGDRCFVAEYTQDVADTWEKATIQVTASPSAGTWNYTNGIGLYLRFNIATGTNFHTATPNTWVSALHWATANQVNAADNVANNMRFALVQLELGNVATEFERRTIQEELLLCQRYYWKTFPLATAPAQNAGVAGALSAISVTAGATTVWASDVRYPAPMRAAPTIVMYNPMRASALPENQSQGIVDSAGGTATPGDGSTLYWWATQNAASVVNDLHSVHMTFSAEL